jgi:UDP-N-acetylglucosamine 4,6-dehydratase/5-epimerase
MILSKTILIFGGTGSLGYELNKKYLENNIIYNFSRDENKHWNMKLNFKNHSNLNFIIGNISNKDKVKEAIKRVNPDIIIIASAMKHIDQCEINIGECLNTNVLGTKNVLDSVEELKNELSNLKTVLFVSSDKACSPINTYGMCKAISENMIVEKAYYIKNIKFINIRYGNVLNSSGSIINCLHLIGKNEKYTHLNLTNESMTRFIMTLEESVNLIEYALLNGDSGDTIISELKSMKVKELIEIFSEKYNKPIQITGIRSGEKLLESLINNTQSGRIEQNSKYIHIKSVLEYKKPIEVDKLIDYNSTINLLSKDELKNKLNDLNLL